MEVSRGRPTLTGRGGFSSGIVTLNEGETVYVYVGGRGAEATASASINPGGFGGGGER